MVILSYGWFSRLSIVIFFHRLSKCDYDEILDICGLKFIISSPTRREKTRRNATCNDRLTSAAVGDHPPTSLLASGLIASSSVVWTIGLNTDGIQSHPVDSAVDSISLVDVGRTEIVVAVTELRQITVAVARVSTHRRLRLQLKYCYNSPINILHIFF